MANRVLEVAPQYPGGSFTTSGSYTAFLEKRAQNNAKGGTDDVLPENWSRDNEGLDQSDPPPKPVSARG